MPDPAAAAADPIGVYLHLATALRAHIRTIEARIVAEPACRVPYSRDELLANSRFPFL